MKKILLIPFLLFAALSMAACGGDSDEPFTSEQPEQPENPGGGDDSDDNPDTPAPGGNGRYLVLYASRTNNTERVAQLIQTTLDCDILEVEPETAYDNDYNAMLERSQEELAAIRQGNYPPIKTSLENFDDYDIVFVGYPIWYSKVAQEIRTARVVVLIPPAVDPGLPPTSMRRIIRNWPDSRMEERSAVLKPAVRVVTDWNKDTRIRFPAGIS